MTVTTTPRLGITRWGGDDDPYTLAQFDGDNESLETLALKFGQRLVLGDAARPSPSTTWVGGLFYDKVTAAYPTVAYTDGVEWINLVTVGKAVGGGDIILTDDVDISVGTTTGTKFGTANNQKIGFFNATPVVQQVTTISNRTALQNLGLIASGGQTRFDVRVIPTGTARPASGIGLGDTIYEERTHSLMVWTGSAWVGMPPFGSIMGITGNTAPPGWVLMDGSAIPVAYTELIAVYGANTPDWRSKSLKGKAAVSDATASTGGDTIPATVLLAVTPGAATSDPGVSDVTIRAIPEAGSTTNVSASATVNWVVKA